MRDQTQIYWAMQEAEGNLLGLLDKPTQNLLSKEELSRFGQMKVEKRKIEWLLGRITAKALLTSTHLPFTGLPFSTVVIDNHPEGAPFITEPVTRGSLSISHRQNIAVCAFTPLSDRKLGIDLEKIETREMSFVEDFFTHTEANHTKNLPEETRHIWSTLVWSAKESILKAWQKGLRMDTRNIEIFPIDPNVLCAKTNRWEPIRWKARIEGYPDCWAAWHRWENFVITIAITAKKGENLARPPAINRVFLDNIPLTS